MDTHSHYDSFSNISPSTSTNNINNITSHQNNGYNPCYPHDPPCITQGHSNSNDTNAIIHPLTPPQPSHEVSEFIHNHYDPLHIIAPE